MKRLKRWLLPLLTVLLIGAGAAMPWAAARFQDRYGIATQEVLPLDAVSLTLRKVSEVASVLRLTGNPMDYGEWTGETGLTAEEACAAAFDALTELDRHGLLESGWMDYYGYIEPGVLDRLKIGGLSEAMPMLLIAGDGSTAIIWSCQWWGNACPLYDLLIDDATGLAVSGFVPCTVREDAETDYLRMDRWMNFFQDCYGIEILTCTEEIFDARSRFVFPFDPEDGLGQWAMLLNIYESEMSFSSCPPEVIVPVLPQEEDGYSSRAVLIN